jgi:hypothetical protein
LTTNKSRTIPITQVTELAQKLREQLITSVQQAQQLSVDAAKTWVDAVSVVAPPRLPEGTGIPDPAKLAAATTYPFDLAADLLDAQRAFAVQLTSVLVPAKSA